MYRNHGMTLAQHGPIVARKREERRQRSLDLLTVNDSLLRSTVRAVVAAAPRVGALGDTYGAMLSYFEHRKQAIRADHFRLRYGRDYWSGRARHPFRQNALHLKDAE